MAQDDRLFEIASPFGAGVLLFQSGAGQEILSEPFEFRFSLLSENGDLSYDRILGNPVTLTVGSTGSANRYFNGIVSEFAYIGTAERMFRYTATLRPWFWLLTKDLNSVIYQNMSVPDIILGAFRDAGFSDFKNALKGTYPKLEYCVQYRESTFNFASRLMEQAGIYYFFTHDEDKHTLVLADSISAHSDAGKVSYRLPGTAGAEEEGFIDAWRVAHAIQSGHVTLNAFDFERPRANLEVRARGSSQYSHGSAEVYDYPGLYTQTDDGQGYARTRLESYQAQLGTVAGHGNAIPLAVGKIFTLNGHPRSGQDEGHLLTGASYEMENNVFATGANAGSPHYEYHFTAIEKKINFRAPLRTAKPVVQGPQTALVVGKSGEEIWTDKYGRINVQFHWDRKGNNDEKSSCWIRVAQPWAGTQFGAVTLPRIGQEVIVDFLEGDPDRPIVTGRVYNASNMPPYSLPGNATQSGIKTNSSKGGGGFNEIRLEDKKGSEEIFINAQKDMNLVVLNNQTEKIDADQTVTIGKSRTTEIGTDRTEKVKKNDSLEVSADRSIKVSGDTTVKIDGKKETTIGGDNTEKVSGRKTIKISGERSLEITGASTHKSDGSITVEAGSSVTIKAPEEISLSCGQNTITLSSSGGITISGMKVTVTGTTEVTVKSEMQTQIQGLQTTVKGTMLTLQGEGIASLAGALTKIG